MGKKRIIAKSGKSTGEAAGEKRLQFSTKKKITHGTVNIQSTYNNTIITLTDTNGGTVLFVSAGMMGFSGAKKGTPYAAARAAEALSFKAKEMGLADIDININGLGAGRESALRVFSHKGFVIHSIKDKTPIPHGYMRSVKPRRV